MNDGREGYHTALGLWRESVAQGFAGTSHNVSRFVTYLRQQDRQQEQSGRAYRDRRGLTVREAVGVLLRHHGDLTVEQQATRTSV